MEINFNKTLEDLDKKPIEGAEMNKILARALQNSTTGDALKLWNWAQRVYAGETLDLDPSDFSTLKAFVENEQTFPVLTKAQLLSVISEAKDAKDKKDKK
jgi:DNA-binding response OmpR family regulator